MSKKLEIAKQEATPPQATPPEVTPPQAPAPEGMAALFAALEGALQGMAAGMGLPLGMEGQTFVPPLTTHLRGKIVVEDARAAALGPDAPIRVDGHMEIIIAATAGLGMSAPLATAQAVMRALPRGGAVITDTGDVITLCTGMATPTGDQADRARVLVTIPFYAFIKA